MKAFLAAALASLAPLMAGLLLALLIARGWIPNASFIGSYQTDLVGLVSRVGLLLSVLVAGALAVSWRLDRVAANARQVERAAQEQSQRRFLRRLDHELKNPLTIIRLGLTNLQRGLRLSSEQAASLERVHLQLHRLQKLVEDLRALTELEEMELELSPVGVGEVLHEAMLLAAGVPGREDRSVRLSMQQAPWPVGAVLGDRDLLIVAFRNLLDNALKFTQSGQRVEVRATDDGRAAVVEVADTGAGIADEDMPHIFEELYRGRNAQRAEGSGLGLTLVRHIIRLHGGEVGVRSRAEQGSVVTVRLRLAPPGRGIQDVSETSQQLQSATE